MRASEIGSSFKGGEKALALSMPGELEAVLERTGDNFEGYESTRVQGVPVVALFDESGTATDQIQAGGRGYVAIAATPFYAEAGGQMSDTGRIVGANGVEAVVERIVRQGLTRPRLHLVRVEKGELRRGQIVTAEVADAARAATRRHHTATHLLHAALRQALGPHVKQAGSLVAPERLRFDFAHAAAIAREQIEQIERIVNEQIYANTPVLTDVRSTEEAIAGGAMALFGEKYGDRVRVVSIAGFSMELCGGTHVKATGDIGLFLIIGESGVASGVRRIEAVAGDVAVARAQQDRAAVDDVAEALNTTSAAQVGDAVRKLQADHKRLAREVDQLKNKIALDGVSGGSAPAADETTNVDGVKLLTRRVAGLDKAGLRGISDSLRDRLGSGVVVLASDSEGRVSLVVSVTKDLTGRVQAGSLVKELAPIVGGGGGGRPDFAEAGGKDPSKIEELLAKAPEVLRALLACRP